MEDKKYQSDEVYTIDEVSDEKTWKRVNNYTINYALDRKKEDINYEASIRFTYNLRKSCYRDILVEVRGYANGEEVGFGEHALLGVRGTGGNVFHFTIPQQLMKTGANDIEIVVSVNASASNQLTEPDEVILTFDEIGVRQVVGDADADGIIDTYDLLVNTHNVLFMGMILCVLFPPITAIGLERSKK
ncbi:MAG: hypothetical protein WBC50_09515 [Dehalococcoidales bacterium]